MKNGFFAAMACVALVGCGQGNAEATAEDGAPAAATETAQALETPTPEEVAAMIDRDGAAATVQALDQGETTTRFTAILEGIATGDRTWLALVPKLAPGVDAGTATGLEIAIAEALPHNAAGVLALGGNGWSVEDACAYPMIEPTEDETRAYFAATIPAVEGVADPAVQSAKATCLAKLGEAKAFYKLD